MQRNRKTILIGTTAAIAGFAAIAGPALATGAVDLPGLPGDDHHEQFEQDLAKELGIPQEQVDKALKSIEADHVAQRIDELQAAGALTSEQADAIKAKAAAGDVAGAMAGLRTAMLEARAAEMVTAGDITQAQADEVLALAKAGVPIGIGGPKGGDRDGDRPAPTAEDVIAHAQHEVEEGALTAEQAAQVESLAKAGKLDQAMAVMMASRTTETGAELVKDGAITQDQADRVLALVEAGVPVGFGGPGGPGHGGPGRGGMDGDHRGGPGMHDDHDGHDGGARPDGGAERTAFEGA